MDGCNVLGLAMIYTIGHAENYKAAIAKTGSIQKLGRDHKGGHLPKDYPGGYAFKSWRDAIRRIEEAYSESGFAVFGMKADWDKDTAPSPNGWWHNLINDSEIVLI